MTVLDCFNLTQHVDILTHDHGHALVFTVVYWPDWYLFCMCSLYFCISDHRLSECSHTISNSNSREKTVVIMLIAFYLSLTEFSALLCPDIMVSYYHTVISITLNTYAH